MTPTPHNHPTTPHSPTVLENPTSMEDEQGILDSPTLMEDEQGIAFQTLLIIGVLVAIASGVGVFMLSRTRDATDTAGSAVDGALAQISDAMALITTT